MTDIDLDAIEARHVAAVMGTGKVGSSAADVPALVALVRAKQSWIDGAKVDLDGYADDQAEYEVAVRALTAERDEARAAIARVRALHHAEPDGDREGGSVCAYCWTPWPCPTATALDGAS